MNTIYFPILKAMSAELYALKKTKPSTADRIVPLLEIPKVPSRKAYNISPTPKAAYINDTSEEVGQFWAGRQAMFDTFHWDPATTVENGEHVIPYTYNVLNASGVHAVPVVGYDRWDVRDYRLALKTISRVHRGKFCIRLDHHAFEDSAEPGFFRENMDDILAVLEIDPANCHVILDFEDVTALSAEDLFSKFDLLFALVSRYGFMSYSIAGCSLPKSIDQAVKKHNSCGSVLRKEMLLWKDARQQYPLMPINFGDYGVRGPNTNEGVRNPHTNGKIRYTIENEYFIARGQPMTRPPKGKQHWDLAQTIIDSGHYQSSDFSWGDNEILRCSRHEFPGGNAHMWIKIDTCHHLAYVVAEIAEFEHTTVARAATVE